MRIKCRGYGILRAVQAIKGRESIPFMSPQVCRILAGKVFESMVGFPNAFPPTHTNTNAV